MKNLKRALCLALACVMLLGMMAISTSATDFSDNAEIVNTDAVNTMTALNIINGKDDGSYFDPTGIVTRGEMAKMICVALNGGKNPQLGTSVSSYTDTVGHWAAGYIEYCTNLGIIAGNGDGTFAPNRTITGTEAAKMLLVAIGYEAVAENFVGATWAISVNVRANQKDLYEDLATLNPSAGLSRDNAAQMVFNAIQAVMVEYDYKLTTVGGVLTTVAVVKDMTAADTVLAKKFDMDTNKLVMTDVSYNTDNSKYTYTFAASFAVPATVVSFSSTADFTALYGQQVKVLSKTTVSGTTGYGVYSISNKAIDTTVGSITAGTTTSKIKVSGTSYDLEGVDTTILVYNAIAGTTTKDMSNITDGTYDKACKLTLVADETNAKIDYAVVTPVTVAKVTYVGATSITAGTTYTFTANNIEAGVAKNDFVSIIPAANAFKGKNTIAKVVTASGALDGLDGTKALIGGKWYTMVANTGDTLVLGESYDLAVVGSYYYNAKKTSDGATVTTMVYVSASVDANALTKVQAKVYFTDGTNAVVSVSKVGGSAVTTAAATPAGLYTYTKDSSGNYELTAVSAANKAGFTGHSAAVTAYTKATTTVDAKLGTYTIADDAVIFLKSTAGTGTTKVVTGATVNDWAANVGVLTSNLLTSTVNGLPVVKAGLIDLAAVAVPSVTGETGNYGYVVSAPYQIKDGTNTYMTYNIWNGSATITVVEKSSTTSAAKYDIISYNDLGSGYISYVAEAAAADAGAVLGFSDKSLAVAGTTTGATTAYTTTEDTVFMYINSSTVAGVIGGEMSLAAVKDNGARIQNVYVMDTAGVADLVVYEVNNEFATTAMGYAANTGYAITAATLAGTTTGLTIATDKTFACTGDTVAVTVTYDGTATAMNTLTPTSAATATVASAAAAFVSLTAEINVFNFTVNTAAVTDMVVTAS